MMRVLVADHHCNQRIGIEKSLRMSGCFRVCPVASFDELITLTHFSPNLYERFDLLIVNAELISRTRQGVLDFIVNNPRLRHALIYGMHCPSGESQTLTKQPHHQVRLVDTISHNVLVDFFTVIDKDFDCSKGVELPADFPRESAWSGKYDLPYNSRADRFVTMSK